MNEIGALLLVSPSAMILVTTHPDLVEADMKVKSEALNKGLWFVYMANDVSDPILEWKEIEQKLQATEEECAECNVIHLRPVSHVHPCRNSKSSGERAQTRERE